MVGHVHYRAKQAFRSVETLVPTCKQTAPIVALVATVVVRVRFASPVPANCLVNQG